MRHERKDIKHFIYAEYVTDFLPSVFHEINSSFKDKFQDSLTSHQFSV